MTSSSFAQDLGWPREKSNPSGTITYYQPQLDEWKDYRQLVARMAISITPQGGKQTLGVVDFRARTDANLETRNVVISQIEIVSTRFASLDDAAGAQMDKLVRTFLTPGATMNISLDRLMAELEEDKAPPATGAAVKNDPPKIFVGYGNAVLLLVDGDTVRAPIEKTGMEFVVNTNWNLFYETSTKRYFLLDQNRWLTASSLDGDWVPTTNVPKGMKKLPDQPNWAEVKKAVPPPPPSGAPAPKVFFSNVPAEIISFKGQPVYSDIPKTQLTYATNTESDLFVHKGEQQYYYLVSGRWFRAKSLDGPWTFASADLPKDFAQIPPHSPRSRVLASVPGTNEANDAVLLAQVPNTVIVDRAKAEAAVNVSYDGAPEFKPIETTTLSYATNTQDKVIKVGDLYYLCFQGVWFLSTKPEGPWKTADSVPKEIYTIPASSPVYNVTYVTQTVTAAGEVEASSTAGYLGMFIIGAAIGATIAYGSGYYYPPYFYHGPYPYPIYRPYPVTYGVGAVYNPNNGAYGVARGAYGPYGGVAGAAWYNPSTGTAGRAVGGCGAYGCAGAGHAYNPYTGAYGATKQGSNAYSQWGSSVVTKGDQWAQTGHYTDSRGTVAGARTSEGGKVVAGSGQNGSGFAGKTGGGDVYAGKNGDVYKKTDGGWQQYENGGWNSVEKPAQPTPHGQTAQTAQASGQSANQRGNQATAGQTNAARQPGTQPATTGGASQIQSLDRDAKARQSGAQRTQNRQRQSRATGSSGSRKQRN